LISLPYYPLQILKKISEVCNIINEINLTFQKNLRKTFENQIEKERNYNHDDNDDNNEMDNDTEIVQTKSSKRDMIKRSYTEEITDIDIEDQKKKKKRRSNEQIGSKNYSSDRKLTPVTNDEKTGKKRRKSITSTERDNELK